MAIIPDPKCKNCNSNPPTLTDKWAKHELCNSCFAQRRELAARAGHWEWFNVNNLLESATEQEKQAIGA